MNHTPAQGTGTAGDRARARALPLITEGTDRVEISSTTLIQALYSHEIAATKPLLTALTAALSSHAEQYGKGVTAGKLEALNYTPKERESYKQHIAQSDCFAEMKASHAELRRRVERLLGEYKNWHAASEQKDNEDASTLKEIVDDLSAALRP